VELYLHSPNTSSWRGAHVEISTGTTLTLPYTNFILFENPCRLHEAVNHLQYWFLDYSTTLYQLWMKLVQCLHSSTDSEKNQKRNSRCIIMPRPLTK